MAERVFLHIGGPKCGTTYLQTVLWSNKPRLAEAGVLRPGREDVPATTSQRPGPAPRAAAAR